MIRLLHVAHGHHGLHRCLHGLHLRHHAGHWHHARHRHHWWHGRWSATVRRRGNLRRHFGLVRLLSESVVVLLVVAAEAVVVASPATEPFTESVAVRAALLAVDGGALPPDLAREVFFIKVSAVAPHWIRSCCHGLMSLGWSVAFRAVVIRITAVGPAVFPVVVFFDRFDMDRFPRRNHRALVLLLRRDLVAVVVRSASSATVPLLLLLLLVRCLLLLIRLPM